MHNLTDPQLTRINPLLRGTSRGGACGRTSPSSSYRFPVRIGDHLYTYQHKAGQRGKILLERFCCVHCGQERVMGVSWDSGFNQTG